MPAIPHAATSPEESEARLKALEERVLALEAEVQELRAQNSAAAQSATARVETVSPPSDSAAATRLSGTSDPRVTADGSRAGDPSGPLSTALPPQVPDTSAVQAQGQQLPNYGGA